ncbi:VOC family protein [Mucilaginibacter daejeonensis]|uniref:VOC family protein n=1 Tax=Mucilaginibacter daejeonensis TaxID=398049 RepID=UPI001D17C0E6|nr:VOC family protein [Mucilaginibacter daejeonensis]UEG52803.1 VOC family protein [Mucilaginibacter daejeonensis]
MQDLQIPDGYQHVMPYLILKDAAAFIAFAQKVLGATEKMRTLRDDGHTIMHAEILIGKSTIMLAEATADFSPQNAGMFVYVADCDAAYRTALDEDATSIMPPADQGYGRSCGVTDPFGNTWWITGA